MASRGSSGPSGQLLPERIRAWPSLNMAVVEAVAPVGGRRRIGASRVFERVDRGVNVGAVHRSDHDGPVVLVEQRDGALELGRLRTGTSP